MLPQTKLAEATGNYRALTEEEQETGEDQCKELYLVRSERKEGPLQPGLYHQNALFFLKKKNVSRAKGADVRAIDGVYLEHFIGI